MSQPTPWHTAYPEPRKGTPAAITREQLRSRMQQGHKAGVDFLLVDLRRTDHKGGTIQGSINLPAQTLYHSLPTVLALCQQASIKTVVWYCGSSRGRGTRAAGWFRDLIDDQDNCGSIESVILLEGISGWAAAGEDYTSLMDEYDAQEWTGKGSTTG